jgi:hypothetical protein
MKCRIRMTMQAVGITQETCRGCKTPFPRGAQMNGIEYVDGTPIGWLCDECVTQWKRAGNPPSGLFEEGGEPRIGAEHAKKPISDMTREEVRDELEKEGLLKSTEWFNARILPMLLEDLRLRKALAAANEQIAKLEHDYAVSESLADEESDEFAGECIKYQEQIAKLQAENEDLRAQEKPKGLIVCRRIKP